MRYRYLSGRYLWRMLAHTLYECSEDKVPRMAAAVAFYTVFSLTPIVVVAFRVAEYTFGTEVALREILAQAAFLIGHEGADGIRLLINNAPTRDGSPLATVLGLGVMVFAATGVFTELKDALNTIWEVQPKPGISLLVLARDRIFGFAMVLIIWFLMLVSLMMSALLNGVSRYAAADVGALQWIESIVSLLLTMLLFALMYRILPDVHVAWRDVWLGAAVTAGLFALGKSAFGIYLGHSTLGSSFGAAGSLIIIILWAYCSCLIVLFGAEMTQVHAQLRHAPIEPTETAVHLTEHDRIQQGIPRKVDIERAAREDDASRATAAEGDTEEARGRRSPVRLAAMAASATAFVALWIVRRIARR